MSTTHLPRQSYRGISKEIDHVPLYPRADKCTGGQMSALGELFGRTGKGLESILQQHLLAARPAAAAAGLCCSS